MRRLARLIPASTLALIAASCGPSGETTAPTPAPPSAPAAEAAQPSAPAAEAAQPAGWRRDGTGTYPDAAPPTEWSEEKNVLWRTKVGSSFSSPVASGDRIFITAEEEKLICVALADGKILWERNNGFKELPPELNVTEKRQNTSCGFSTPTPAADGKHVYAVYGTGIVVCFDYDGNRKWVRYFDLPQATADGRSASPVVADGKLLISLTYLFALDAATGKTLWEAKRADVSYGTPAVAKIGGELVILTPVGHCVRASDGEILAKRMGTADYASPVVAGGHAYYPGSYTTASVLPEKAEEFKPKEAWEADIEGEFFSSPVYHDGMLYCVSNEGRFFALDAKTGKTVYEKMLQIPSAAGLPGMETANLYGSLALAGGRLFVGNDIGYVLVLEAGREYKEVAKNAIDEGSGATPVFAGKRMLLRGGDMLYCVGTE